MADPVTDSIIVKGSVEEVYGAWANFTNFPRFMSHITSVEMLSEKMSHWKMEGPLGVTIEWNAQTTRMEENKRIAWNSTGGTIKTSGQVTFNNLPDNQTEVTVTLKYDPPGGAIGEAAAALFANPDRKLADDLRNFKAFIEG